MGDRFGTHYDTVPHGNCNDEERCDCECPGCMRAWREHGSPGPPKGVFWMRDSAVPRRPEVGVGSLLHLTRADLLDSLCDVSAVIPTDSAVPRGWSVVSASEMAMEDSLCRFCVHMFDPEELLPPTSTSDPTENDPCPTE